MISRNKILEQKEKKMKKLNIKFIGISVFFGIVVLFSSCDMLNADYRKNSSEYGFWISVKNETNSMLDCNFVKRTTLNPESINISVVANSEKVGGFSETVREGDFSLSVIYDGEEYTGYSPYLDSMYDGIELTFSSDVENLSCTFLIRPKYLSYSWNEIKLTKVNN